MNKTTAIALKFFALYLLFSALVSLPSLTSMIWMRFPMAESAIPTWVVPTIVLVVSTLLAIIGAILIWKSAASLMKNGDVTEPESKPVDLDRLLRLALSLMGLFFVFRALIALPQHWTFFQMMREHRQIFQLPGRLGSTILQLVIGGWLIARPRQWACWLLKFSESR